MRKNEFLYAGGKTDETITRNPLTLALLLGFAPFAFAEEIDVEDVPVLGADTVTAFETAQAEQAHAMPAEAELSAATFVTKINGKSYTFTQGANVGGHYSDGCLVAAGETTWTNTNQNSGHYCCYNNATEIYKSWWGSTPSHSTDNFLRDVSATPNTTENMKKWLSVSEPGARVTIGNTYGNYNGHTVIFLGVDPSDSNYMWIINTNGHGTGLNPVEKVSWSYLPTYLSSSYNKIISTMQRPRPAPRRAGRNMTPARAATIRQY